ncbi:MAG: NAD(P)-dependent alcohol dehydrogenase [Waddliaceae bacterium]
MIKAYAVSEPGGKCQPFTYEPGPLEPHDVEIDVEYCGICHSDVSMLDNAWGITQYPLVPGHEAVGKIAAIGEEVKNFKVGDRVGLGWHSRYCLTCMNCMEGDHNLCQSAQGTIVGRHGAFAEKVRADAASVIKLPPGIDIESAGPLFCGGITVFNPIVQFNIRPTDKVGVIGIGGLGHLALKFLNAWGCEVTAFTSSEAKRTEALELGAHKTIDSRHTEEIEKFAGQFDYIISTVNIKLDWNTYLSALRPKGRLHFVGATLDPLDLAIFPMILKQQSVSGSPVGSPATITKMLDFAALHQIKPTIETFPLDKVNEAIERLRSGQARYRIVLNCA